MADILKQLGKDFADRLVQACGGRRVYIPTRLPRRGPLHDAFNEPELRKLIAVSGGGHVDVPVGAGNTYGRARSKAEGMLREGYSANEIANKVGLSRRTVFMIKARMRDLGQLPPRGQVR
ncbi:hypothetical protein [Brevundimonas sp.]|uniref:hypothetical protein n=1 Tax=Brevundimonas sp. TaxID=1871086 RepID=UPI003D6D1804